MELRTNGTKRVTFTNESRALTPKRISPERSVVQCVWCWSRRGEWPRPYLTATALCTCERNDYRFYGDAIPLLIAQKSEINIYIYNKQMRSPSPNLTSKSQRGLDLYIPACFFYVACHPFSSTVTHKYNITTHKVHATPLNLLHFFAT